MGDYRCGAQHCMLDDSARKTGATFSAKKYRVPVLRARECAIATAQAETAGIAPRCLAALPHRWSRRSVVSLEAQRSAAAALACPSSLTPCLPPLSAFSRTELYGSRRRETLLRVRRGTSRYRTIGKWYLSGHQSNCTPRGQSSRTRPLKRAQPEHRRALIPEGSSSLIRDDLWSKAKSRATISGGFGGCAFGDGG